MTPAIVDETHTSAPSSTLIKGAAANHQADGSAAANGKAKAKNVLYRDLNNPILSIASGDGIWLETTEGKKIMDACGGAAVACLGAQQPKVLEAMVAQAQKISFAYSLSFTTPPAEELANWLVDSTKGAMELVGFYNGGSEAVEAAIKMARQFYWELGQRQRVNFIARRSSYHGNLGFSLAIGGHAVRREYYEPLLNNDRFHHVSPAYPFRYRKRDPTSGLFTESEPAYVTRLAAELEAKFQSLGPSTVAAFMFEPVVGATLGVVAPPRGYFKAMKEVCERHGALLILDEVMSGMGRTGTLHAWMNDNVGQGVEPDMMVVAKGLAAGFAPLSAAMMAPKVATALRRGTGMFAHGITYQAMALACAAGIAVQRIIEEDNLLERCRVMGAKLGRMLRWKFALYHQDGEDPESEHVQSLRKEIEEEAQRENWGSQAHEKAQNIVGDIRGMGMFWGVEYVASRGARPSFAAIRNGDGTLRAPSPLLKPRLVMRVHGASMRRQLSAMPMTTDTESGEHTIFAPAYTCTAEEIKEMVQRFVESVEEVAEQVEQSEL